MRTVKNELDIDKAAPEELLVLPAKVELIAIKEPMNDTPDEYGLLDINTALPLQILVLL